MTEASKFIWVTFSWTCSVGFLTLLLTILIGRGLLPILRKLKVFQMVSEDVPTRHQSKAGTPTMGGIIILLLSIYAGGLLSKNSRLVLLATVATVCFGLLGFLDDYIMIIKRRALGLKARYKFAGQIVLASLFVYFIHRNFGMDTRIAFAPGSYHLNLSALYYPFAVCFIVGIVNAVNLTDGLDGLAAGTSGIALLCCVFICLISTVNNKGMEGLVEKASLGMYCAALSAACFGFLWFNFYPAQVFMGDTGSLALGAALSITAILTKTELPLLLVGAVFVLEAFSVILQVIYFKCTSGKRIFKMSPLHHHFELSGWSEPQIVLRFWLLGLVFGLLGLFLFSSALGTGA